MGVGALTNMRGVTKNIDGVTNQSFRRSGRTETQRSNAPCLGRLGARACRGDGNAGLRTPASMSGSLLFVVERGIPPGNRFGRQNKGSRAYGGPRSSSGRSRTCCSRAVGESSRRRGGWVHPPSLSAGGTGGGSPYARLRSWSGSEVAMVAARRPVGGADAGSNGVCYRKLQDSTLNPSTLG